MITDKYFPFHELQEKLFVVQDYILFAIVVFLVYTWIKLFLYWDK